jgi:hypothetical protein
MIGTSVRDLCGNLSLREECSTDVLLSTVVAHDRAHCHRFLKEAIAKCRGCGRNL